MTAYMQLQRIMQWCKGVYRADVLVCQQIRGLLSGLCLIPEAG